jgi:hypothetical protein
VLGGRVIKALRRRQTVVCLPMRQKMLLADDRWRRLLAISEVSYAAADCRALREALMPRLGASRNRLPPTTDSQQHPLLDRARHDLYISLVQPLGVKSTIQNFDGPDGKIGRPRRDANPLAGGEMESAVVRL